MIRADIESVIAESGLLVVGIAPAGVRDALERHSFGPTRPCSTSSTFPIGRRSRDATRGCAGDPALDPRRNRSGRAAARRWSARLRTRRAPCKSKCRCSCQVAWGRPVSAWSDRCRLPKAGWPIRRASSPSSSAARASPSRSFARTSLFASLDRGNARGESDRATREVCEVVVVGVRALRRRAPHGQLGLGLASLRRAGALDRVAARQGRRRQLPRRRSGALPRRVVKAGAGVDEPGAHRRGALALPAQDLRPARRPGGSRAEHRGFETLRAALRCQSVARVAHVVVTRNLEWIYDNETAIRALALVRPQFPSCRMSIAGTGPELERLRQTAIACGVGDAVAFAGRLDRDAIAALYKTADIALNPSRVDNMPNSILEALAQRSARREHASGRRALHGRPRSHRAARSAPGAAADGREHRARSCAIAISPTESRAPGCSGRPAVRLVCREGSMDRHLCPP